MELRARCLHVVAATTLLMAGLLDGAPLPGRQSDYVAVARAVGPPLAAREDLPSAWPAKPPGGVDVRPFAGRPGVVVADPGTNPDRTAAPPRASLGVQATSSITGSTFIVNWNFDRCVTPEASGPPVAWPDDAKAAFNYALGVWGSLLKSSVPIEVNACLYSSFYELLATGRPLSWGMNFPNAPWADTWYPAALVNALAGSDLMAGPELEVDLPANVNWYYGTDGIVPAGKVNFVGVVLHELGHGLGFLGGLLSSYNVAFCGNAGWGLLPCPEIYDRFATDKNGVSLVVGPDEDPRPAGRALVSEAYFSGPNAMAQNGGNRVRLRTPAVWDPTSYIHLDESFAATEDAVMTSGWTSAIGVGPVTQGMFRDMGWTLTGDWPSVDLSGPAGGTAGPTYTYAATFSPITTTVPITYTWTATDLAPITHTARGVTDSVDLSWATPGTKNVVVTASGAGLPISTTLTVFVGGLAVSGPASGLANDANSFDATFWPTISTFGAEAITETQVVTYTWLASDLPRVVHTDQGKTDSARFTWTAPGTKTVTVTATGWGATFTETVSILITPWSSSVDISGPLSGTVATGYAYTASFSPVTTTQPLTYTWVASDFPEVIHRDAGITDTVVYTWTTIGTRVIWVTVTGVGPPVTDTILVSIRAWSNRLYIPIVLRGY